MNWWRLFDLIVFAILGYLAGRINDAGGLVVVLTLSAIFSLLEEPC